MKFKKKSYKHEPMLHLPWDLLLQLIRLIWKDCVITIIIILKNDKTMIIMKKVIMLAAQCYTILYV